MTERQLQFDRVPGPDGTVFEVSTIRTDAGGAPASQPAGSPFSSADYLDETPWPFETMVFPAGSNAGLYHQAYASQPAALQGHATIVRQCRAGTLPIGQGVQGKHGTPSLTAEAWRTAHPKAKAGR